jgi:hypothetical protein
MLYKVLLERVLKDTSSLSNKREVSLVRRVYKAVSKEYNSMEVLHQD